MAASPPLGSGRVTFWESERTQQLQACVRIGSSSPGLAVSACARGHRKAGGRCCVRPRVKWGAPARPMLKKSRGFGVLRVGGRWGEAGRALPVVVPIARLGLGDEEADGYTELHGGCCWWWWGGFWARRRSRAAGKAPNRPASWPLVSPRTERARRQVW
jgi:hypothetical protein